ncbi:MULTISPECIES: FapA family protein [unclassified Paenibacillus]|uniref:FapA family protein n=1 Tax=unclassified Paenibacillus TaxID=185978 RepID=UPI001AE0FDFA|nr:MULTISPECIES: FapA family protein [unclassified Paenibacillus]MBP1153984.1 uncharacterized protein (DUF342 family) [Paenibacillus sp. PvP091]MBP1170631.1 uncharacterized protein (DUF342 family) [Paenibacillus sp. PvR098]MBP2441659.1 uncharacterized protein (DUF342 family) [Paenibacillus sp. PvP052]
MIAKGKSVVSKGKTVKEAVVIALNLLEAALEDAEIEIIENESRGILGFGSKLAVVRVTVNKINEDLTSNTSFTGSELEKMLQSTMYIEEFAAASAVTDIDIKATEPDLSGMVWVSGGHIHCRDAPDKYPLVMPGEGMKLFINEKLIEKTVIVSEKDIMEVELQDREQLPQWEINVSANKMEAFLKVVSTGARIYRRLKDKEPSNYIQLEIEEKKIPVIIDAHRVMEQLSDLGIVYGVNYSEIVRACTNDEAGSYIIAQGEPPSPGKNGYFKPAIEVDIKRGLKERSDGTIDYREIQEFPSVERGQVLGIIYQPIPGTPGKTVTNDPVLPPEVFPLAVKEGHGVVLVEEGTKVVATDAGQPKIKVKGNLAEISVVPKLMITNDVNLNNGNVHYIGDVEVVGSVQDGMVVEAQGSVMIHQNVNMAKISAGDSVIIRNNIISSEVTAGNNNILLAEIHQILGKLITQMKQMVEAISQLSSVSAFKVSSFTQTGLGPLIKILCDGKFKSVPTLTMALKNNIKSGIEILDHKWVEFGENIYKGFMMPHASPFRSVQELVQMTKQAEALLLSIEEDPENTNCFIKASFVHNSKIYSSGDITVIGQGVYNSKLHAGGDIEVEGYVRGGEFFATHSVTIGEAGTKGGVPTKIVVPKEGTIKLNSVMEDVVIQVGSKIHKFSDQSSHIFARLSEDGDLLI